MKKLNNKGFSLVELIIVIAIMVILVAVLAPQFTKYVEKSRIGTDVQNASEIATAVQVALAEGKNLTGSTVDTAHVGTGHDLDSLAAAPTAKSTTVKTQGGSDAFSYTVTDGKIEVKVGTVVLFPAVENAEVIKKME